MSVSESGQVFCNDGINNPLNGQGTVGLTILIRAKVSNDRQLIC